MDDNTINTSAAIAYETAQSLLSAPEYETKYTNVMLPLDCNQNAIYSVLKADFPQVFETHFMRVQYNDKLEPFLQLVPLQFKKEQAHADVADLKGSGPAVGT